MTTTTTAMMTSTERGIFDELICTTSPRKFSGPGAANRKDGTDGEGKMR